MNVLSLAWRSVRQRPLSSVLTAVSVALGVALTIGVLQIREAARDSYAKVAQGYDVILGPTHGSPLTIVLNTMFHIGDAKGTVPWEIYEAAQADERVARAVPYAVGDTFRTHHVVGTSEELFTTLTDRDQTPLGAEIRGRMFHPKRFEAVVGSITAGTNGLRLGDEFFPSHGLTPGGKEHTQDPFVVVGVLRPTGTPADRAIFIPIAMFYEIEDHKKATDILRKQRGDDDLEDHRIQGLSAVGIKLHVPYQRYEYLAEFRRGRAQAQAAIPVNEVGELMRLVEKIDVVFELIAYLVVLVAAVGILVSLYNTIQGRRREIAILRALGARPHHVFTVIVLESLLICMLGGLLGLLVGHGAMVATAPTLVERYGVVVSGGFQLLDLQIMIALAVVGVAAGVLPAWRGLRTPVAENLHPQD